MKAEEFIKKYEYLYYDPSIRPENSEKSEKFEKIKKEHYGNTSVSSDDYKDKQKSVLGIGNLNGTDFKAEELVMDLLKKSIFNKKSLAWKAGKVLWQKNNIKTVNFDKGSCYINGYGRPIDKREFDEYCKYLKKNKTKINELVKNNEWEEAYEYALNNSPKNIGPVYIINALFFITKGRAPIYDKFAHKAVRSLLLGIAPSEVYLGGNPDKKETEKVVLMYREYMKLLNKVFPNEILKEENDDMFISRELDRALWVYGHSIKQFEMRLQ